MSLLEPVDRSWDEPGCFEVAPSVYRIPLPLPHDGLRAVNVYAIVDGDRLVMIDSGQQLSVARSAFEEALKTLGASLGDISQFLVTHIHRDHYTQAVAVRREFATPIALGVGEQESISSAA
jgi:glyoxylase-like metal-dependent hydrolase (beta-lactamase superfamily II)